LPSKHDICAHAGQKQYNLAIMKDFSYITNSHPAFIENLYQEFVKNPESVDPDLKKFFEGFDFAVSNGSVNGAVNATTPGASVDERDQSIPVDLRISK
jgi:2-oxoglutarate dehydrogenase complex dehydrogenase (E1) component-like enzyme